MKKIILTLPELAAVSAMVEQELQRAVYTRTKAKAALQADNEGELRDESCDEWANVDYWSERVRLLHRIKAKLELETEEEP